MQDESEAAATQDGNQRGRGRDNRRGGRDGEGRGGLRFVDYGTGE